MKILKVYDYYANDNDDRHKFWLENFTWAFGSDELKKKWLMQNATKISNKTIQNIEWK